MHMHKRKIQENHAAHHMSGLTLGSYGCDSTTQLNSYALKFMFHLFIHYIHSSSMNLCKKLHQNMKS